MGYLIGRRCHPRKRRQLASVLADLAVRLLSHLRSIQPSKRANGRRRKGTSCAIKASPSGIIQKPRIGRNVPIIPAQIKKIPAGIRTHFDDGCRSQLTVRAAKSDRLQTSLNLALGSALATIGLTIPAVAILSILTDLPISLGLDAKSTVLLFLSLIVASQTLANGRTTVLQGVIHLMLFAVYLFTTFVP